MPSKADFLVRRWRVRVNQGYYHCDGKFYNNLKEFPGGLFDPDGYVIFRNEQDYNNCPHLNIGVRTNATRGISRIPGYIKML